MTTSSSPIPPRSPSALWPMAPLLQSIRKALPATERARRLCFTDRLSDLGIGSLRVLALVMDLEDAYGLSSDDLGEIGAHTSLGDLIRLCLRGPSVPDEPATIH